MATHRDRYLDMRAGTSCRLLMVMSSFALESAAADATPHATFSAVVKGLAVWSCGKRVLPHLRRTTDACGLVP
jgi:hypothetical protein